VDDAGLKNVGAGLKNTDAGLETQGSILESQKKQGSRVKSRVADCVKARMPLSSPSGKGRVVPEQVAGSGNGVGLRSRLHYVSTESTPSMSRDWAVTPHCSNTHCKS
jgi:hypothetical protein